MDYNKKRFFFIFPILLVLAACATARPPQPDPLKEQLSILRKQLLELQVLQNDTRSKLDQATSVIEMLTVKVNALDEKQFVLSKEQSEIRSTTTAQGAPEKKSKSARKNKRANKKKKVRRQE